MKSARQALTGDSSSTKGYSSDLRLAESAPCRQAANRTLRCGRTETGGISEARNNTRNETNHANERNPMGHADLCPECIYVPGRMP